MVTEGKIIISIPKATVGFHIVSLRESKKITTECYFPRQDKDGRYVDEEDSSSVKSFDNVIRTSDLPQRRRY